MENVCYNGIKKISGGILVENRRKSNIAIGKNMADMRSKFSLTQKDISQVVGVNVSTYKHYELGDRFAPLAVIRDLANFYKISTDYFFENMPELSIKDELEISRRAFEVSQNKSQMIGDIKNFAEGMAKLEEKAQARARLRVKQYRLDNKKSQQDVADYLGIDISTYNKYEKGSRKLNNEVVRKIAEYYNIKVSDILD
jgi:DNA-binding helix-turn-helix protein